MRRVCCCGYAGGGGTGISTAGLLAGEASSCRDKPRRRPSGSFKSSAATPKPSKAKGSFLKTCPSIHKLVSICHKLDFRECLEVRTSASSSSGALWLAGSRRQTAGPAVPPRNNKLAGSATLRATGLTSARARWRLPRQHCHWARDTVARRASRWYLLHSCVAGMGQSCSQLACDL